MLVLGNGNQLDRRFLRCYQNQPTCQPHHIHWSNFELSGTHICINLADTTFVNHDTKCEKKNTKKISYGSQRPVVVFIVACGQYAPKGQAVVRGERKLKSFHKPMFDLSSADVKT
jgi:hypothetical protein